MLAGEVERFVGPIQRVYVTGPATIDWGPAGNGAMASGVWAD